jgi:septum site-determining protein MinD
VEEPVKEHLIITRYAPNRVHQGEMLAMEDILEILGVPLLGVIPESQSVLQASNAGTPVALDTKSDAGQAYLDVVARFLGEEREHRFLTPQKKSFVRRLFGG